MPSLSRIQECKKTAEPFETLGKTNVVTQYCIPEYPNPQQHGCGKPNLTHLHNLLYSVSFRVVIDDK